MGEREQHRSRLAGVVDLDHDLVLEKEKNPGNGAGYIIGNNGAPKLAASAPTKLGWNGNPEFRKASGNALDGSCTVSSFNEGNV